MSGPDNDNEAPELDNRRKKILFRCWHRGMKEMDLILGGFAKEKIAELTEDDLTELENLMQANDQDLYAWITGRIALPEEWDGPLYRRIIAFHEDAIAAGKPLS